MSLVCKYVAMDTEKKRKVDLENLQFNTKWTYKYAYIETPAGRLMFAL